MNLFQLTAARRRLGLILLHACYFYSVSTHSRPKAAGTMRPTLCATCACFNSQPPEGGWIRIDKFMAFQILFQLTAARRRLGIINRSRQKSPCVSTHSRPKAAGRRCCSFPAPSVVSTHSRPKAAGRSDNPRHAQIARFNSQPPEGGWAWVHKPA